MTDRITADVKYLKKLFVFPDSQDRFRDFGHMILDMLHTSFKEKNGIHSSISLTDLEKLFSQTTIPRDPKLLRDIFPEIHEKIVKHSVKVYSPYYIGHMTSAVPYFTILLEMIISSLNQNQVKIETAKASTYVERELIAWIHRLIYEREESFYKNTIQNYNVALGNVTSGGTLANMTALCAARNKLFCADGSFPGIMKAGIAASYSHYNTERCVMIMSKRGHYSFDKVADVAGIGPDNLIKIDVDSSNKIDILKLKKELALIDEYNDTHDKKIRILSLIGIAGTTETGNIDNLQKLQAIASERQIHFHVDAAWGGPVLFVKDYKHLFTGIEKADSVTFDSHKLLYLPLSMGMVLFRNEHDLSHIRHTTSYVVRKQSRDLGKFTIEGSRPFTALRPWVALKVIGSEGFRLLFENAFSMTSYLRTKIDIHPNFEAMNTPELFICNYRFVPEEVKQKLLELLPERDDPRQLKKVQRINRHLNDLNLQLHREIRNNNRSFVSRTILEATKYAPDEILVLRAITINPLTDNRIIHEILLEHDELGCRLYQSQYRGRLSSI
ncbi:MAG: pyridoxal-dependent decarboxylase [Spirochaetota bacterium]